MADNSYKLEFTLSNGRIINAGTIVAPQGEAGKNGVTFTPSVSEAGVLSWTNDGGLPNPDPVNIKGDAAVITESDVAGWGFTKNVGTITEIKMNGASKGTSGVVDLGTVLTEHQSLENYVTLDGIQDIKGKKTVIPPANKDNSNQIATTAWAGRRYKSIADFGFTSQTTVKAIVQKIIDNWYEYCTFACTNDNFNNFSDTPDGYGTLIIEVGSNALRPFISFTKQIGDSNSYKYWQANIVRGENNQVSEIQWYEIINSNLPQTISGEKTFVSNIYISQTSGQNAGITWKSASDNTNRGIFRHYDDGTTENFVTQSDGFLFRPLNNNNTKSIKVDPKIGVLYPEQNSGADLGKTTQRWNAVYAGNTGVRSTGSIICDSKVISYNAVESNKKVPDFNAILKDDLYTTAPTETRGAQYLARDTNGAYIGGLRIYHNTNGTIQSQLLCRSQNTDVQNYVYFQARPDATSNAEKDKFAFIPRTNGNIDLGLSNNKWNNGYITNIKGCNVINDSGDNLTINGTTTVVTPPDTDDSTQIANTAWVRSHNQAIRGFDGQNYYTVDGVKKYYPADNYFLVAYTDHCTNWKHVCAEMDVVDLDTRRAVYKLKVSGLLESATSNNITTYTNKGSIGVTDSFGERLNTGTTDINNEFFLVCRTTNKGHVRYEIWYNQRYAYNRHKFYFSVDEAHARTGITEHFTWNKMRIDNGTDVGYAKAGVTAYMDSKKVNPTYIPTSSWGVDVFKTAVSKDESYTNVTIFNNNLYSTTQVGVSTILNTTPYVDAKIKGYSGYKTIPSAQKTAEYRILSEDKGYLGGVRYDKYTNGDSSTRLCVTSTLSGASNNVMIYATKGTASTKSTDSDIWAFVPATDGNITLGGSGNRWKTGYITNIQRCKFITGGGGNLLIQQDSDTSGADITVGNVSCPLKFQGKNGRPTYSHDGSVYADIAFTSDMPTALSELTDDMKVIVNNTDASNSWAFSGGGNILGTSSSANNCVSIGAGSITRYQKSIRIGTAMGQTPTNQSVTQIGVNNYTSSGRALYLGAGYTGFTYMNSAGSSWTSASDIRDKTDIQTIDHALDFIKKLKPITYVMNDRERYLIRDKDDNPILDENGKQQYDVEAHERGDKKKHRRFAGLSAQDTYQAMLDCYNNDTNYAQIVDNNKFDHPDDEYLEQYSMSYERLVPFLIKAVQEQQAQIDALKNKIAS